MKARATLGGLLASSAVLGIGLLVGTSQHPPASAPATTSSPPAAASGTTTSASTSPTSTPEPSSSTDGTWTGDSISTRFGSVQVRVLIAGGTITDVTALRLTDHDGRSVQISNEAAPILRDEVLSAQSSAVSMVSGATYTSRAYLTSLQSALDQAGF